VFKRISKMFDPLNKYCGYLRSRTPNIVSNASLKILEMLIQIDAIIPKGSPHQHVFCNAELPGAFILAISHFMQTYRFVPFDWIASSFESPGTLTDTFGLKRKNRERWIMGPPPNAVPKGLGTTNGDISDVRSVRIIIASVRARFPDGVTLYTGDVGIDVGTDYLDQERKLAVLAYAQIVIGILTLAKNGSMIVKQFTMFEKFTRSTIALLTTLFADVRLVKPAASRAGNSEIYIVATKFNNCVDESFAERLITRIDELKSMVLPFSDWPPVVDMFDNVSAAIAEFISKLVDRQISQLQLMHQAFEHAHSSDARDKINYGLRKDWIRRNPLMVDGVDLEMNR